MPTEPLWSWRQFGWQEPWVDQDGPAPPRYSRRDERRLNAVLTLALLAMFTVGPLGQLEVVAWNVLIPISMTVFALLVLIAASIAANAEGITRRAVLMRGFKRRRRSSHQS